MTIDLANTWGFSDLSCFFFFFNRSFQILFILKKKKISNQPSFITDYSEELHRSMSSIILET